MSYEYRLEGQLTYADADRAKKALDDLRTLLKSDDPDLANDIEEHFDHYFTTDDATVTVDLVISGPGDFWFSIEALAETLASTASDGALDAYHELDEGEAERFEAGTGKYEGV